MASKQPRKAAERAETTTEHPTEARTKAKVTKAKKTVRPAPLVRGRGGVAKTEPPKRLYYEREDGGADRISRFLDAEGLVPEHLRGTDKYLDVVA